MTERRVTSGTMAQRVAHGACLASARREAGLSLRAVGDALGLSHVAVSHYERGINQPSPVILVRMAALYNVPIGRLFTGLVDQILSDDPHLITDYGRVRRERINREQVE